MNFHNNRQIIERERERNLRLRRDLREAGSSNEMKDLREQQLPRDVRQTEYREPRAELREEFRNHG